MRAHGQAKLSWESVRLIRLWHKDGIPVKKLAHTFSISKRAIYNLLENKTWRHPGQWDHLAQ